jgi:hypothetical protein
MKTVYVVTMWSGGRPAKKWKTDAAPEVLTNGTGVTFINLATRLRVTVVGSISVEEYESGKEEIEMGGPGGGPEFPSNIERLY